jgi:rhodanese domain-containing protein
MYKKITPAEAKKIIDNEDVYLVDVREEDELIEGYLEDSILIPLDTLKTEAERIIPDKNKEVLVYCRSGKRSAVAVQELVDLGYSDVMDIGGIMDWPFEKIL